MAKFEKRIEAHKLRRKGNSIKAIAEELDVAKSTVSIWCRDIALTRAQAKRLKERQVKAGHRGRMIGAAVNRQKKEINMLQQQQAAADLVGKLSERDKLMLGVGLYWGEGVKQGSSCASLVNSEPELVLIMRNWFEQLGVKRSEFRPYIYISEIHRPREQDVVHFWSRYLSIPRSQFKNVIFLQGRPKKVYENHDSYYGILALRVKKSTSLKYKILGMIDHVKNKPM